MYFVWFHGDIQAPTPIRISRRERRMLRTGNLSA